MADERLRQLERNARTGGAAEQEALHHALEQVARPALARVEHREALAVLDPELGLHVIRASAFRFERTSWLLVPASWRGLDRAVAESRLRAILGALYAERAAQTSSTGDPNVMELESFTWTLVEPADAPGNELDGAFHLVEVDERGGHTRVSWRDREGWLARLRP